MNAFTYILLCSDDTFYTGWTVDLQKRLAVHNHGKGSRYTRCRLPVEIVYYETFVCRKQAMAREYEIKKMTRVQKQNLIDRQ